MSNGLLGVTISKSAATREGRLLSYASIQLARQGASLLTQSGRHAYRSELRAVEKSSAFRPCGSQLFPPQPSAYNAKYIMPCYSNLWERVIS